jgi:hypothetical protein
MSDVFAELARVGRRIPLGGLAPADIESYVATVTGSAVSRRAVARLHEVTGGNPFFLGEVVASWPRVRAWRTAPGNRSGASPRRFEP